VLTPTEVEDMWRHVLNFKVRAFPEASGRLPEALPVLDPEPRSIRPRSLEDAQSRRPHA
jgi:hypothetical protein